MPERLIRNIPLYALLACVTLLSVSCSRTKKYGYVDIEKVVKSHPMHLAYLMNLKDDEHQYHELRREMIDRLTAMKSRFDALEDSPEKSSLENELNEEFKKLQIFDLQTKASLENQSRDLMTQVVSEIQNAIEEYRQKHHYAAISNNPADLNARGADDITDIITNQLQEKYLQN